MTDATKSCPVEFLALTTHEGALYAVSKAGSLLPLYVFEPLAEAYVAHPRYRVDFAPDWPVYAVNFVLGYLPLPELTADQIPDDLEPKISVQERPGDSVRPWKQTKYNGWPLYFSSTAPHRADTGGQPVMFVPATVDLPMPQDMSVQVVPEAALLWARHAEEEGEGGGVGLPGPYIGP